jgi:hypothetical protein
MLITNDELSGVFVMKTTDDGCWHTDTHVRREIKMSLQYRRCLQKLYLFCLTVFALYTILSVVNDRLLMSLNRWFSDSAAVKIMLKSADAFVSTFNNYSSLINLLEKRIAKVRAVHLFVVPLLCMELDKYASPVIAYIIALPEACTLLGTPSVTVHPILHGTCSATA